MNHYCFILGKNPTLSIAEIFNQEAGQNMDFKIIDLTSQALIIQTNASFDPQYWQSRLGGTIKIVKVIGEFKTYKLLQKMLNGSYLLKNFFTDHAKKNVFGFSLYGGILWRYHAEYNTLGLQIKKELSADKYKARFVAAEDGALTSVQVTKNKMITRGADIAIISGIHSFYIGKTVAVQDFENYSARDYGRPKRDAKSGMLPPKLAQIMINLSQASAKNSILDPFCGSGTILQEARLMGFKKIIGSDISRQAVNNAKQNVNWLEENNKLPRTDINIFRSDIKELPQKLPAHSINNIITEPYLGPLIKKNISTIDMLAIIQELENLYLTAFHAFSKILKSGGQLVIAFPLFKTRSGIYSLKILEQLDQSGFHRQNPFPAKVSLFAKIGPTARGSLIYQRPDQTIEREIFIFQIL